MYGLEYTENGVKSDKYHLIDCDITETEVFFDKLVERGVDFTLPTLVFSECVLAYIDSP